MSPSNAPGDIDAWLAKLQALYAAKGREKEFEAESQVLRVYLTELKSKLPSMYRLDEPHKVGGSGVVFKATQLNLGQELALKFNRPSSSMLENELAVLPTLNHSNIIRPVDSGRITISSIKAPPLLYLLEPFVRGVRPLDEYVEAIVSNLGTIHFPATDFRSLNESLEKLFEPLQQWINALLYLHSQSFVYLDVKPENAVVDEHRHLVLIDFGTAQKLDDDDHRTIDIYFSKPYAHPWLRNRPGLSEASSNRVRGGVKRSDLKTSFDLYAMGRSVLWMLNKLAESRKHDYPQLPLFRSLHFLATRLLDGENEERVGGFIGGAIAAETFGGLRKADYETIKYSNLTEVLRDVNKELGSWSPEFEVPELETYAKDVVRVVPGWSTVMTKRLKALMEHPLFARLRLTSQLGLVSFLYPGANHSRYEHILGSYTYTANFVKSLFNDRQTPIFRNLVDGMDIKAVLLAALLHDLGQYPLAHDLQEVNYSVFGHSSLSIDLLSDPTKDASGRTILDVIRDEENGWGVDPDWLRQILGARSRQLKLSQEQTPRDFKVKMLSALIDGPIDADKCDYITRDSLNCKVPYGMALDVERLMRVLTVAPVSRTDTEGGPHDVTVGVYEKGRASAESFGFARYMLFASVYWHHTSRIIRAMLQYSTAMSLPIEVFVSPRGEKAKQFRQKLTQFTTNLIPPFENLSEQRISPARGKAGKLSATEQPLEQVLELLPKYEQRPIAPSKKGDSWYPGISWTDWMMLRWIRQLPDASSFSRSLIDGLLTRRLYKRVATLPRSFLGATSGKLDSLTWPQRIDLCKRMQERMHDAITTAWPALETAPMVQKTDVDRLFETNLVLLVDIPNVEDNIGFDRPLVIVPELRQKSYYQESERPEEAETWEKSLRSLMAEIGPIRVLCHPELRSLITSSFQPIRDKMAEEIASAVGEVAGR